MRQTHAAGEKLFVDYAGDTVPVIHVLVAQEPIDLLDCMLGCLAARLRQSLTDDRDCQ